ncbi:MAG: hypothetical protein HY852_11165 [Bradyrhizobium sp.]|uniref:hypothetical protein n=1 Tax=Bradyrhizobium sp. TaxID=376 RepID=UPI0025BA0508|nr:hypothetical protein [Bradyrhizobium sp.]MBI5262360.1 hypothetical protein [Bradyrhizobium sp.]
MNCSRFFANLAAAAVFVGPIALQSGTAKCGEMGNVEFVRALYEKQARAQAANVPPSDSEFTALFSDKSRRLMRAPRAYPANAPIGPILNAFFGWGVLPKTEVGIGTVARVAGGDTGPATIAVDVVHHGTTHKVFVHVLREDGGWRIDDI